MSNLRLIDDTTVSGVASVNITDVFTSDFDVYKVVATDYATTSGTAARARLRFINPSGSVISTSNYDSASLACESAASSAFPEVKATGASYIDFVLYDNGETGGASAGVWYIFNPFSSTIYSFASFQESHFQASYGASTEKGIGVLKQTASMSGYQVYSQGGSSAFNGRFRTYGLRVDS
tara:strand:- start:2442 stop:2978 length:537 start_codon:yes stop_codon:yes gene_type:complete